jgi:thymidylate synthase (FAD)
MRIIEPFYRIMDELDSASAAVRLEVCGRVCYKSEDKIGDDSAIPFVTKIAAHGHNSVLEMAVTTYKLFCSSSVVAELLACQPRFLTIDVTEGGLLITASMRAYREIFAAFPDNRVLIMLRRDLALSYPYLFTSPDEGGVDSPVAGIDGLRRLSLAEVDLLPRDLRLRHRFVAVRLVVNRAVTHELVRHRPCSFLQESQRYCRYSEDKFGSEVTFIKPVFFEEGSSEYHLWQESLTQAETAYFRLLETSTPQAARTVLPNSCKTEIIVFCNLIEWRHIFMLRTSLAAEPSMREIMVPLREEMERRYGLCDKE